MPTSTRCTSTTSPKTACASATSPAARATSPGRATRSPPRTAALLEGSGATIESRSLPGPSSAYYPNVSEGHPLSEKAVRDALQISIDRETYAATIYGADYPVVEGPFDTTTPFFVSQADALAYDPRRPARSSTMPAGCSKTARTTAPATAQTLTLVAPITAETPGRRAAAGPAQAGRHRAAAGRLPAGGPRRDHRERRVRPARDVLHPGRPRRAGVDPRRALRRVEGLRRRTRRRPRPRPRCRRCSTRVCRRPIPTDAGRASTPSCRSC